MISYMLPWVNVVYWTLAIEFQWYLLVGLMFPLLASRSQVARFVAIAAMMISYFMVGHDRLIFHSIPDFSGRCLCVSVPCRISSAGEHARI